ncbi:MAG: lipid-transfer protein [Mycobacterium sp.]|uniref:lipid-transfer protein n=1 Tax=Mycobacterium sp. TaxID=1785 RepID=UPI003C592694
MVDDVVVLGVGMHPWGKWGRSFVEYGVAASRAALADAGLDWPQIGFISGGNTIRNGYPGHVSGSTFARALGCTGCQVASSYSACATGSTALSIARAQILAGVCDVALAVGADTTPKGFFAPNPGDRPEDPDWLRFRMVGATNPVYFGLHARRRMELYGMTLDDLTQVKLKNSRHAQGNRYARFTKRYTAAEIDASPIVSDPLRLFDICATSDGAAAVVLSSKDFARRRGGDDRVRLVGLSLQTPTFPDAVPDLPYLSSDSTTAGAADTTFKATIAGRAFAEAGIGADDVDVAEVYDLSSAMELDWYEQIGLCGPGEASKLLHAGDTAMGGRVPVNPSGGLGAFGEAPAAQALAQVCELTWQLRRQAGDRTVDGASVGLAINQGLFGHGSCVILAR